MIKSDCIFDDVEPFMSLWVGDDTTDTGDLARVAEIAIDKHINIVSVPNSVTGIFWPWLEGKNIKILSRFNFQIEKDQDIDSAVSEFAKNLTAGFRAGASGTQVFVSSSDVVKFADAVRPIRDDLFFDRYLAIAVNIDEMCDTKWADIFNAVSNIHPNAILIFGNEDTFNPNSDFVGRMYDMLENWNLNADLHLMFGKNMMRFSQVLRLGQRMTPNLVKNMRVFLEH